MSATMQEIGYYPWSKTEDGVPVEWGGRWAPEHGGDCPAVGDRVRVKARSGSVTEATVKAVEPERSGAVRVRLHGMRPSKLAWAAVLAIALTACGPSEPPQAGEMGGPCPEATPENPFTDLEVYSASRFYGLMADGTLCTARRDGTPWELQTAAPGDAR